MGYSSIPNSQITFTPRSLHLLSLPSDNMTVVVVCSSRCSKMNESIKRSEFQLPLGDLGLELGAVTKDPKFSGHGLGCQIRGWKNLANRSKEISAAVSNLPIGSRIIVIDGEYVEKLPFREVVKRIQESRERVIIVEYETNEENEKEKDDQKSRKNDEKKIDLANFKISQDILNILDDDHSPTPDERHQNKEQKQQQQRAKKEQLHLDGKLYLLQGQVEKATIQLKESHQHSMELENVIKLQAVELEKKQTDILHLKTTQRETDGQVMLLKYRLDKSQTTQQRLQLLTNGDSQSFKDFNHQDSLVPLSSSEVAIASPTVSVSEVEVDRFAFLCHVRKLSSSLQQIRKQFQSNANVNPVPLEEIDGIAVASLAAHSKLTRGGAGSHHPPQSSNKTQLLNPLGRGIVPKEVEVLSDYRQDEFSEYIRSKLGLGLGGGEGKTTERVGERQQAEEVARKETQHHPTKLSRRSDAYPSQAPPTPLQDFSFPLQHQTQHSNGMPAHGGSIPHFSHSSHSHSQSHPPPQPQSQSSSRRGSFNHRSQFQVESQLLHQEVQRFRNFMSEMRVDCSLAPSSSASSSTSFSSSGLSQHRSYHFADTHPQGGTTSFKSSDPPHPLSSAPLSSSSSSFRSNTIASSSTSSSSLWKSSLNASMESRFQDEIPLDGTQNSGAFARGRARGSDASADLNFSHLRKISTSPPLSHFHNPSSFTSSTSTSSFASPFTFTS